MMNWMIFNKLQSHTYTNKPDASEATALTALGHCLGAPWHVLIEIYNFLIEVPFYIQRRKRLDALALSSGLHTQMHLDQSTSNKVRFPKGLI